MNAPTTPYVLWPSNGPEAFRRIYKGCEGDRLLGHTSRKVPPSAYIAHKISTLPRCASGSNPLPTSPRSLAPSADPHQSPLGNPAFSRMSALNSPARSRSGTPLTDYPLAFMVKQQAQARSALILNPWDLPDISAERQANTIPAESTTVALLSHLVKGLVTISDDLSRGSQNLATLFKANEAIREDVTG